MAFLLAPLTRFSYSTRGHVDRLDVQWPRPEPTIDLRLRCLNHACRRSQPC